MIPFRLKAILITAFAFVSFSLLTAQHYSEKVQSFIAINENKIAFRHAKIIDGEKNKPQDSMTIIISEGKIEQIGKDNSIVLQEGVREIDCRGKTIIPGFVMMHEHLFYTKFFEDNFNVTSVELTFPRMYLAGGVTTMRTAGSISPYIDLNTKKMIQNGTAAGPDIDVTGPFIDRGDVFIPQLPVLEANQSAGDMVDYWADQGCTSFKIYMHISREDLRQVVERAHARGLKVTGHLCSITMREAAEIGIDNIEHGFMSMSDFDDTKEADICNAFELYKSVDRTDRESAEMEELLSYLIEKGVAVTTTPAVFDYYTGRDTVGGGGMRALAPEFKNEIREIYQSGYGMDSAAKKRFEKELFWNKKFYDMGGQLLIGTDPTGAGRVIAGYGNMYTLEILVNDAGFSLTDAIYLTTLAGAEYLGEEEQIGSLAAGKDADFILINGDLTEDVRNIRKIELVFKHGIGYDSEKLFQSVDNKVGTY